MTDPDTTNELSTESFYLNLPRTLDDLSTSFGPVTDGDPWTNLLTPGELETDVVPVSRYGDTGVIVRVKDYTSDCPVVTDLTSGQRRV